MFLPPYQIANNPPLMAEIDSRICMNPIAALPFQPNLNFTDSDVLPISHQGAFVLDENSADGFCSGFPANRKRARDSFHSHLDREISIKIQRQHQEIERCVLLHTEKTCAELEAKRRLYLRQVVGALESGVQPVLKKKQEEIERLNKKNIVLEEKLRALRVEGQLWQSLAQANEATVTALNKELEQVILFSAIAGVKEPKLEDPLEEGQGDNYGECCDLLWAAAAAEDAGEEKEGVAAEEKDVLWATAAAETAGEEEGVAREEKERVCEEGMQRQRSCRGCGEKEVSVLVLPCRHLCLCSDCNGASEACPVCLSPKAATVQVFMS